MKQKTCFTKFVKFGLLFENVTSKVKVKLSFGQKEVIVKTSFTKVKVKLSFLTFDIQMIATCYLLIVLNDFKGFKGFKGI